MEELFEKLEKSFADFRAANDLRLKEIEEKGKADPLLEVKVNKINDTISNIQAKIEEKSNALDQRLKDLEDIASQPSGPEFERPEYKNCLAMKAFNLGKLPEEVEVTGEDMDAYRNYKAGVNMYMRRGDASLPDKFRNAMSAGSDPAGGYWVTPDMSGRISSLIYESSPMRQVANVQTINTDELEGFNDLEEAGAGWVGEAEARPDTTEPNIGKWKIPVHEQYASPKTTQKLLDDATVDVEAWLVNKASMKLARSENTAFVTGNGVTRPRGFLTYGEGTPSASTWSVIQTHNTGVNGGFAASDPGDVLIDCLFSLKAFYRTGAVWMMSRATMAECRKLKDGQGNYMWQHDFQSMSGASLLGFPIVEAEDMPVIATDSYSIAFGNFNIGYQIVDRMGVRVLRDPYTDKPFVKMYTTKRVGGDVVNFEAIKTVKFAA